MNNEFPLIEKRTDGFYIKANVYSLFKRAEIMADLNAIIENKCERLSFYKQGVATIARSTSGSGARNYSIVGGEGYNVYTLPTVSIDLLIPKGHGFDSFTIGDPKLIMGIMSFFIENDIKISLFSKKWVANDRFSVYEALIQSEKIDVNSIDIDFNGCRVATNKPDSKDIIVELV